MEKQSKTESGEESAPNDKKSGNNYWRIALTVLGTILVIGFAVGVPIAGIVYVCRTFLGDKQTEIGLPVIVAYLAFVAVVAQLIVSKMQWKAMREQLTETQNTLKQNRELFDLGHRPSIGVDRVEPEFKAGHSPRAIIQIRNSGHSPAKIVSVQAQLTIWHSYQMSKNTCPDPILGAELREGMFSQPVLPVNGCRWIPTHNTDPITPAEIQGINAGQLIPVVWMRLEYQSFSGVEYFTQYYGRWTNENKAFAERSTHNDAN